MSKYLVFSGLRDNFNHATSVKPLHVVVTHTHFDHSGEFEKITTANNRFDFLKATNKFVSLPKLVKILVSGGLHYFDDQCMRKTYIYVHENECNIMLHSSPVLRAYKTASWVTSDEILIKPYPEWSGKDYQVNGLSKAISIKRNHIFDLGNFNFNVSYNCG